MLLLALELLELLLVSGASGEDDAEPEPELADEDAEDEVDELALELFELALEEMLAELSDQVSVPFVAASLPPSPGVEFSL